MKSFGRGLLALGAVGLLTIAIANLSSGDSRDQPQRAEPPSNAQDVQALINKQTELNDKCRGGSGAEESTQRACDTRDRVFAEIESKGWCYGEPGQAMYQMEWHPCDSTAKDRGGHTIAVQMSVAASQANPPVVTGTTNLPDGTELNVHLVGEPPACTPRCGVDYGSATVQRGSFTAALRNQTPLLSGSYTIDVVTVAAFGQPLNIQAVIGENGEHLRGPYVVTLERGGNYAPMAFPRNAPPSEGEKALGLMIHFTQKVSVASDPSRNAK